LVSAADNELETAGVLLCGSVRSANGDLRLLGREMHWVTDEAYKKRAPTSLSIAPEGYVAALGRAEQLGAIPVWFHTHPRAVAHPVASAADKEVDRQIADLFRMRSGSPWYGTLIMSPRPEGLSFTGMIQHEGQAPLALERLWRVEEGWYLSRAFGAAEQEIAPIFDRSVRAFGPAIQRTLAALHVGLVGCGGTGSAVAEQLVRLGVRHLTLVDADTLTASNVTRVYGSTPADVGRGKVDIQRSHLTAIAPNLHCENVHGMVTLEATARTLSDCDVIFGCTDDNAGRLVLSRLATYLLIPVIDLGVLISSDGAGRLVGIDGRVTILSPGDACLVCRDRIDLGRAAVELRTPEERKRLADEGYAPALGGIEPAVVTFTTAVASAAVTELLERLIGFGPEPRPTEILLRWHEREISTNRVAPRANHYCDPAVHKLGQGDSEPFLDQAWPTA
jgi:molybdopterin/thiamine biosynthesis adenylyltransferase